MNMIFNGTYCVFKSKVFPQFIHHVHLMLHHGMDITVQRNGRILVSQDLRKRLDVHAAFDRSGGKRMSQRMEAMLRNTDFTKKQFKTALIRSYGRNFALVDITEPVPTQTMLCI